MKSEPRLLMYAADALTRGAISRSSASENSSVCGERVCGSSATLTFGSTTEISLVLSPVAASYPIVLVAVVPCEIGSSSPVRTP